jgi:hypothetical protein
MEGLRVRAPKAPPPDESAPRDQTGARQICIKVQEQGTQLRMSACLVEVPCIFVFHYELIGDIITTEQP